MFRQYTDATYSHLAPRPEWLGSLGPILRAEVDDIIVVHLKNFATRSYSMHPHGVFYKKDSEGMMLQTTFVHIETHIYYLNRERFRETSLNKLNMLFIHSFALIINN